MTIDKLIEALPALREHGVTRLRFGDVEVELGAALPAPALVATTPAVPASPRAVRSPYAAAHAPVEHRGPVHDADVDPQHGVL